MARRRPQRSPLARPLGSWATVRDQLDNTHYMISIGSRVSMAVIGFYSGARVLAKGERVLATWREESRLWHIQGVGGLEFTSFDQTVGPGNPDDGHWTEDLGDYNPDFSPIDLHATATASLRSHIWLFFGSWAIPSGATITKAALTMKKGALTASPICDIHMNDVDDAVEPVSVADMAGKALTTASVEWTIPGSLPTNTVIESPDFTAAVQEVINRPGWASGQDLMVILKAQTTGGLHEFPTTVADDHHLLITAGVDSPTEQLASTDLGDFEEI